MPFAGDAEASPIAYSTVSGYAEMDFGRASVLARQVLADGLLTDSEYKAVIDAADAKRLGEYEAIKARVKGNAQ